MRKIKTLLLSMITLLLAGCTGIVSATPVRSLPQETLTSTTQHIPSATFIPSVTTTPTMRVTPTLSPTPAVTSTPPIPPEARLKIQCLDMASELPSDITVKGRIVLDSLAAFTPGYLLDVESGINLPLSAENQNLVDLVVSPDGSKLAFERATFEEPKPGGKIIADELVIIASNGQVQKTIPWEKNWFPLVRWLDNERLVIGLVEDTPSTLETLLILNPFTGQRRILLPDFPGIYDIRPADWGGNGETMYDPTLTRVVYPKLRDTLQPLDRDYEYVLWDLQAVQTLVTLPSFDLTHLPTWSPEGNQFIVAINSDWEAFFNFELFSVTSNGEVVQLSNLNSYYTSVDIARYSWSPDGRYIAFWLNISEDPIDSPNEQLAVLDLFTQEVTNYCIPGDYGGPPAFGEFEPPPVWSPNSKQIVVENRYDQYATRVILVDVVKNVAVQIAENMRPRGWMESSP